MPQDNTDIDKITSTVEPADENSISGNTSILYAAEQKLFNSSKSRGAEYKARESDVDKVLKLEQEQLKSEKQNRKDRKKYANRIFWMMVFWIAAIIALVIAEGFGQNIGFHVSDKVLIALISGTTINILGIFIIVARYLFNHVALPKNTEEKTEEPEVNKKKTPTRRLFSGD